MAQLLPSKKPTSRADEEQLAEHERLVHSFEDSGPNEPESNPSRDSRNLQQRLGSNNGLWTLFQTVLLIANLSLLISFIHGSSYRRARAWTVDGKLPYRDLQIRMVDSTIVPGGFHDQRDHYRNEFEGPPSATSDAAWDRVGNIQGVFLDENEYSRFPGETAKTVTGQEEYFVSLTLFHQLHCVRVFRDYIWTTHTGGSSNKSIDHLDHCVDFIRQTLMCYGDLTPQTFGVTADGKAYYPIFRQQHQCRDFESIVDWVKQRPPN